jgi:hypothetical protein
LDGEGGRRMKKMMIGGIRAGKDIPEKEGKG